MIDRGAIAISNAVESAGDSDAARKGRSPKSEGDGGPGVGGSRNTRFTVTTLCCGALSLISVNVTGV